MLKKVMIGLIAATVAGGLGVAGYGLYQAGTQDAEPRTQAGQGGYGRTGEQVSQGQSMGGQGERAGGQGQGGGLQGQGGGGGGPVEGGGSGRSDDAGGRRGGGGGGSGPEDRPATMAEEVDWLTVEGVISYLDTGLLTVETSDGEQVEIALGPEHYWTDQGVSLSVGDEVSVRYFVEDGENKGGEITLAATGETLVLRDDYGRPMWSGSSASSRGAGGSSAAGRGGSGSQGHNGYGGSDD